MLEGWFRDVSEFAKIKVTATKKIVGPQGQMHRLKFKLSPVGMSADLQQSYRRLLDSLPEVVKGHMKAEPSKKSIQFKELTSKAAEEQEFQIDLPDHPHPLVKLVCERYADWE